MPREKVLELLIASKGEYLSGEIISSILKVSRAAVCKDIKAIRAAGYNIESVTNKGYKLITDSETLNLTSIKSMLKESKYKDNIVLLDSVDSTNTYAKMLAMKNAKDGTIVVSREQTDGRGRRGKSFISPEDNGLYFSVILRPFCKPNEATTLTAYAAVAFSEAIFKASGVRPSIKWINDLIINNRKVAGILTEMSVEGETGEIDYIVLGIGINAFSKSIENEPSLVSIATSLETETGHRISLNKLCACVIDELDNMLDAWSNKSPTYKAMFEKQCITINNNVYIGLERKEGFAIGIDDNYGLLVKYSDGSFSTETSGDVAVKGLFDN